MFLQTRGRSLKRLRLSEVKSLHLLAAEVPKYAKLRVGFHSIGQGAKAKAVGDPDDRADQ
jgi:hypothetical protein